jgi:hypothetical protein
MKRPWAVLVFGPVVAIACGHTIDLHGITDTDGGVDASEDGGASSSGTVAPVNHDPVGRLGTYCYGVLRPDYCYDFDQDIPAIGDGLALNVKDAMTEAPSFLDAGGNALFITHAGGDERPYAFQQLTGTHFIASADLSFAEIPLDDAGPLDVEVFGFTFTGGTCDGALLLHAVRDGAQVDLQLVASAGSNTGMSGKKTAPRGSGTHVRVTVEAKPNAMAQTILSLHIDGEDAGEDVSTLVAIPGGCTPSFLVGFPSLSANLGYGVIGADDIVIQDLQK